MRAKLGCGVEALLLDKMGRWYSIGCCIKLGKYVGLP